ncbi:hypothetical protein CKAH01_16172 [Colletotrichum kahawae]|uniref:Cyanovirin-N domain-containing protein n=1 Tax=Colletotrichum kahawae TaxID=34407 RepID=A0AAD9YIK5_COLKA|nr:hypothetical protein CKAH01_16172 [Colletotrichum kahawae]
MKFTSAVTALVVAFAVGPATAEIVPGNPSGGWFKRSCKDYKLTTRSNGGPGNGELVSLEASCRAIDGNYKSNRLDLTICIGNFDGQMGWRKL